MDSKHCNKCNFDKSLSLFNKNKTTKDGLGYWCKPCMKEWSKCYNWNGYRKANVVTIRKNARKYASKFRLENPELVAYRAYRVEAKRRSLDFKLDYGQFKNFFGQPCHYCGLVNTKNGLDRVDNDLGYILENVVSCCIQCNRMKMDYTVDEFIQHCHLIVYKRGL